MIVAWLLIFWDTFFWFNFEHLNNIYDSSNFLNSTASFNFHLFLNAFYDCFLSRFLVLNPFHVLSLPFSSNIPYINYLFEPAGSSWLLCSQHFGRFYHLVFLGFLSSHLVTILKFRTEFFIQSEGGGRLFQFLFPLYFLLEFSFYIDSCTASLFHPLIKSTWRFNTTRDWNRKCQGNPLCINHNLIHFSMCKEMLML